MRERESQTQTERQTDGGGEEEGERGRGRAKARPPPPGTRPPPAIHLFPPTLSPSLSLSLALNFPAESKREERVGEGVVREKRETVREEGEGGGGVMRECESGRVRAMVRGEEKDTVRASAGRQNCRRRSVLTTIKRPNRLSSRGVHRIGHLLVRLFFVGDH
jgi:hypothetical protein